MFENFVVKTDVFSIFAAKIHIQDAKMMKHYGAILSALSQKPVAIDVFRIPNKDTEYGYSENDILYFSFSHIQDDISDILFSSIPYCPLPDVSQQQQGFKGITFCAFMQRENYTSGQRIPPTKYNR